MVLLNFLESLSHHEKWCRKKKWSEVADKDGFFFVPRTERMKAVGTGSQENSHQREELHLPAGFAWVTCQKPIRQSCT